MDGKTIRFNRISLNGKILNVPLDHGFTNGPISRLSKFRELTETVIENGATAVIIHKGMVRFLPPLRNTGLIIHISASTEHHNEVNKSLVCDVQEALKHGADAVSIHVNIGNSYEQAMLRDFSIISNQCKDFGVPLLAMMYFRNNENTTFYDEKLLIHSVRVAVELGADIVKVPYCKDDDCLKNLITSSSIPIVFAGGEKCQDTELLERTQKVMFFGASGISYGRNIFESSNPAKKLAALRKIVIG
jgi:class I fructose-bisphosphate aldolase